MKPTIIDVREPFEYASGHVPGALNIPLENVTLGSPYLASIPRDAHVVVYCLSGQRASIASGTLKGMGYTHVENGIDQAHVMAKYHR